MKNYLLVLFIGLLLVGCGVNQQIERAKKLESKGKVNEAIKKYQTIIKRYPTSEKVPDILLQIAEIYNKQNNLQEAISYYLQLISKYNNYPKIDEANFKIANIYYTLKNYEQAEIHFQIIIDRYPNGKFAESAKEKILKIENIKKEIIQIKKEAETALGNKKYALALEKYEKIKSMMSSDDIKIYNIDNSIAKIKNKLLSIERDEKFVKSLENAKKMDWGDRDGYLKIYNVLDKQVYGKNEFEWKRDEERAEADYIKITNTVFYIPIELDVGEYDFSQKTLSFKNISSAFAIDSGPNETNYVLFDKDITFGPLELNGKEAERIKNLTAGIKTLSTRGRIRSSRSEYFVRGFILCKVIGQPESKVGILGYSFNHFINAKIIDARIEVPKIGYIYLN